MRHFIGNDLVYLPDFKASFNELFKKKVFTAAEIAYCESFTSDPLLRYASTFAAKEASYKAIKQAYPEKTIAFKSLVISRKGAAKKPFVNHDNIVHEHNGSLTLTHDGAYVWAIFLIALNT